MIMVGVFFGGEGCGGDEDAVVLEEELDGIRSRMIGWR